MKDSTLRAWLANQILMVILYAPKILPYPLRIRLMGWVAAHVIAPIAGYDKRATANLTLTCPHLPNAEITRIARAASNNAGRAFGEMYSRKAFFKRIAKTEFTGPGLAHLQAAQKAKRPIIAVSGHFGNYDVLRALFTRAGHQVGGLYRPMSNVYFNAHYTRQVTAISAPSFEQGRRGLAGMIKHLRSGNMIALLTDQRDPDGAKLRFFGQPVLTPLSAAEMALKYDALLIPAYGIRRENGLDFDAILDHPIAHSDPETMMQQINDSLEAQVRAHMGQWLWIHRRWKMPNDA